MAASPTPTPRSPAWASSAPTRWPPAQLTLDQGITTGRHTCADGTVTLTAAPDGALRFTFRGKTGPVASGTLAKS